MGMTAALKARDAARNARYAVAIELMCAAQALDFRRPLKAGRGAEAAWKALRAAIPTLDEDRALHRDIETAARLVETGALERAVIESGSEIR
jgi:histidine ammonia-lyase